MSATEASRTVLVTGATGFIGRKCLAPLLERGYEVHAVSFLNAPEEVTATHWHQVDLLDVAAARTLLERVRPTHLLHLAWFAKPGEFWTSEQNFRWLDTSLQLFEAFYQIRGRHAVGVGSCAEYEWTDTDCDEAKTPLHPDTIYGRCKLAASQGLGSSAKAAGRSAAWARLFFPYGPGEPPGRLIPAVIEGLLGNTPVACTHGYQQRDFIYVDDVASALVELLSSEVSGTFNIGTGKATSLREIVGLICERLGGEDLVKFGARTAPPGDPQRVVASIARMTSTTSWRPLVPLEQGIEHTITSWRDRLRLQERTNANPD